jgi:DNA-binding MarR family transcriptional regulator
MNNRLRHTLNDSGLSPRDVAILTRLAALGATSQQSLQDALAIDASGLVAILNDLERTGLAGRHRDPADRRRHIVEITESGRSAIDAVDAALDICEREAFADLDDDEVDTLLALLARVRTRPGEGCPTVAGGDLTA